MENKTKFIIITSIIVCVIMYIIEQILPIDYVGKTVAKIVLFVAVPILFNYKYKQEKIDRAKNGIKYGVSFGILAFVVIVLSYFLFENLIDGELILVELGKKNIDSTNFLFVGLYIIIGNSFLEELFFRGFTFLNLYRLGKKRLAYIFSSLLFSLYHIGIFITWFDANIIIIAVVGLFTAGIMFCWINTKSGSFFNSWIVHASADLAIIIVGFYLLSFG